MMDFWRGFFDYCGAHEVAARLDDFTSRLRQARGLAPDWHLEERRGRRAEAKERLLAKQRRSDDGSSK